MSVTLMGHVFSSDVQPTAARFTLLALADNATDGGYCRPGIEHLIGKTGLSRSTVFRSLAMLEEAELIRRKERRRDNGSRRSNAYRINIELLVSRRRKVTSEEEAELEAYFDDDEDSQVTASSHPDTMRSPAGSAAANAQVNASCQPDTMSAASCHRDTGGGVTVTPLEPSVEPSVEEPPQPPERGELHPPSDENDPPVPVQAARPPRAQVRAERAQHEAAVRRSNALGAGCDMCIPDGQREDGSIRWIRSLPGLQVALSPYDVCDHTTPHLVRVAQLAAIEEARTTPRAAARANDGPPPAAGPGREEAMRAARACPAPSTTGKRKRARRAFVPDGSELPADPAPVEAAV